MANNYFQFKQFTIHQDHCAMKVCTDACIFGAYVAAWLSSNEFIESTILDIGTGTGLLSLMVVQKSSGIIDAIEMDEGSFEQAKHNFERSPWANQLNIFNTDALQFYPAKKYDCIICNPPFFEDDLKSGNEKKNAAKHDTTLTLEQLLLVIDKNLSPKGFFAILVPFYRVAYFTGIAVKAHYYLNEQLLVQHTEDHPFFRGILFFSRNKTIIADSELVIKNAAGNYTPEFTSLLKDYYLHL